MIKSYSLSTPLAKALSAVTVVLGLSACSSLSRNDVSLPDLRVPKPELPASVDGFERTFYAGVGFGSTTMKPDTDGTAFTGEDQSAGGSQLGIGYDLHDRLSLQFDSSQLGEADLNEGVSSIKYSSFAVSGLFYAGSEQTRAKRQGLSAYGRLGYGVNKRSSNVRELNVSDSSALIGLGAEYGLKNGIGLRAEVTRYDSESLYAGLGMVFRFGNFSRFIPQHMVARDDDGVVVMSSDGSSPRRAGSEAIAHDGDDAFDFVKPVSVTVLANANDHDADGVVNERDRCPDTTRATAVDIAGCGLFDGTLANSSFSNGSAKLNASSKAALDILAVKLVAFPEVRVSVEAYTDDKGPSDINLNVSQARAEMVRNYLVKKGVGPGQLEAHGRGEINPVADNSTDAGRDANRRIEFVTLPSMTAEEAGQARAVVASAAISKSPVTLPKVKDALDGLPVLAAAKTGIDRLPAPAMVPGLYINGVLDGVSFEPQSTRLKPKAKKIVQQLAASLASSPSTRIAIMAHTNDMPSATENMQLSMKQARTIMTELVKSGVNRRRLKAEGYGETLPRYQNLSERHMSFNRRVEIRILE